MVRTRVYGWLWSEKVFIGVHSWWQLRLLLPSGRLTSLWFPYEINEPGKGLLILAQATSVICDGQKPIYYFRIECSVILRVLIPG